jgi:hypothetical protein
LNNVEGFGASGSVVVNIPVGTATYSLWDGSTQLGSVTITGACADGTTADTTGVCRNTQALRYTGKVYALWTDKYPFVITRTDAARVKNVTRWNGLGNDLFNCLIANYALSDGKILALCKDLAELKYRVLYINPLKNEFYEYVGELPANLHYTIRADGFISADDLGNGWGDVQKFDPTTPTWGARAQVADGWYFTPNDQAWVLKFQDNAGAVSTLKAGTFEKEGNLFLMISYNN